MRHLCRIKIYVPNVLRPICYKRAVVCLLYKHKLFIQLPSRWLASYLSGSIILSPSVNKEWTFTCGNCPYVPGRDSDPDTVAMEMQLDGSSHPYVASSPWVPHRCRACETRKKRRQRMKQRTRKIWRLAEEILLPTYHFPKLITFSLLTDEYYSPNYHTRYDLLGS